MPADRVTTFTPWHIVFVLDDSGTMTGDGANAINQGLAAMFDEMEMQNQGTKERIWVSAIRFGGRAELLFEHQSEKGFDRSKIPTFTGGSGTTNMTDGLEMALAVIRRNPGKTTDFSPYVFLLTDGKADNEGGTRSAADRLKQSEVSSGKPTLATIGCGADIDMPFLQGISSKPELAVHLKNYRDIALLLPAIGTVVASQTGTSGVNQSIANLSSQIL